MVDGQLRAGGVTEPRLLSQFRAVPRERFVPEPRHGLAYVDDLHWFGTPGSARFMPAPVTLARLMHLADIRDTDAVLDIGAASGYATAILAGLAASVTALESDAQLAAAGSENLAALGLANARMISGTIDQLGKTQFDAIIVQGMLDTVPSEFIDRLKDGGRLIALIRKGPIGIANVVVRSGDGATVRAEFNAFLPPLPGTRRDEEFVF